MKEQVKPRMAMSTDGESSDKYTENNIQEVIKARVSS